MIDPHAAIGELEAGAIIFITGLNAEERAAAFEVVIQAFAVLYRRSWPDRSIDVLKEATQAFGRRLIRRFEDIELAGGMQAGRA